MFKKLLLFLFLSMGLYAQTFDEFTDKEVRKDFLTRFDGTRRPVWAIGDSLGAMFTVDTVHIGNDTIAVVRLQPVDTTQAGSVVLVVKDLVIEGDSVNSFLRFLSNSTFPEVYGARGDGTTNDAVALKTTIEKANGKNIILSKTYAASSQVLIDATAKNIQITALPGAKIVSTYANAGTYGTALGAVHISGANSVTIEGLEIQATNTGLAPGKPVNYPSQPQAQTGTSFLSALVIEDVPEVHLNKCKFYNAPYNGVWVVKATKSFSITNCEAKHDKYAGIAVSSSYNGTIDGCHIDSIGYLMPSYGYGITLLNNMTWVVEDMNISITNNHIYRCQRKNIDVHNGIGVTVANNTCKGFGYGGIYAVAEYNTTNVRNVIVTHNDISQDSAWFYSVTPVDEANWVGSHPIQLGTYGNLTAYGSMMASENIIHDCNVSHPTLDAPYIKYMIHSFADRAENLKIVDNFMESTTAVYGVYIGGTANYGQPDIVTISDNHFVDMTTTYMVYAISGKILSITNNPTTGSSGTAWLAVEENGTGSSIDIVQVSNNPISGTYSNGIVINDGDMVSVLNNVFTGGYSGQVIYIDPSVPFVQKGNIVNLGISPTDGASLLLPDYDSKSQGQVRYAIETSGSGTTLNTLTVNAGNTANGGYDGGSAVFDVTINIARANGTSSSASTVKYQARAFNSGASPTFSDGMTDPASSEPTLSWDVSGTTGQLQITLPNAYTAYEVIINFSGWRLTPYQEI